MKEIIGTIVFIDIKSSSTFWDKHKLKMFNALNKMNKLVNKLADKYNGFLIKTIGDAFMLIFKNDIIDAIQFVMNLQFVLNNNKIQIDNDDLHVRIGVGHGKITEYEYTIQNNNVLDYFGSTVNMASRMESKVSPVNGFALGMYVSEAEKKTILTNILALKDINKFKISSKTYKNNCNKTKNIKRSERLLNIITIKTECEDKKTLHGVKLGKSYVFELN